MEITFDDSKLEILFFDMFDVKNSKNLMQRKVGKELSVNIKKRINQLKASTTFASYIITGLGKPHILSGNKLKNCYGISLTGNYRLIIKPKVTDVRAETLATCDTIIVKGVIDYHGSNEEWLIP